VEHLWLSSKDAQPDPLGGVDPGGWWMGQLQETAHYTREKNNLTRFKDPRYKWLHLLD